MTGRTPAPPAWAARLLARVVPRVDRASVLAEMEEFYVLQAARRGARRARWWYVRHVLQFVAKRAAALVVDPVARGGAGLLGWWRRVTTHDLMGEVRVAGRSLRRSPAFTVAAVGVLGLGMAGAVTIGTLVYAVILKPLPYAEADRLVAIFTTPSGQRNRSPSAPANVLDWRRDTRTVDHLTAAHPWGATLQRGEPRKLSGLKATWSLFDLLEARPLHGRTWHAADSLPGDAQVVVLGHGLWQREFGADPAVIGSTVRLDGIGYRVIGVMPPDFGFPPFWAAEAEFWVPLDFGPEPSRRAQFVRVFGRLRDGVTLRQARSNFEALHAGLTEAHPEDLAGLNLLVESLHEPVVSGVRPVLWGLLGATLGLLMVAVLSVTNLVVGRALARTRDRAVRRALGASPWQLVVHDMAQGMFLSLGAAVVGLALAAVAVRTIRDLAFLDLPRASEIGVGAPSVVLGSAIALLIGLVLGGVLGARRGGGGDAESEVLRASAGLTARMGRTRDLLVVAEVALAAVLLVGAGLTLRSMAQQERIDTGLRPSRLLTMTVDMGGTPLFPTATDASAAEDPDLGLARQTQFFRELQRRAHALPGVEAAGLMSHLPLAGDVWGTAISRADGPPPPNEDRLTAVTRAISPGLVGAMGMTLLAGRDFTTWGEDGVEVILVNATLAERLWPGEDPVGEGLRLGSDADDPVATVIGVVADVKQGTLLETPQPEFYRPYGQNHFPWYEQTSLVVRSTGEPGSVASAVRGMIRDLEPLAPVTDVRTMGNVLAEELFAVRATTSLVTVLAAFAVVVSGIGLFGVISYLVGQRRREFGIRMALGTAPDGISRLVLARGAVLVLAGLAIGLAVAAGVAGSVGGMLYGVPAHDPVAFGGAALGLALIGFVAAWLPARRAARVDPAALLRAE